MALEVFKLMGIIAINKEQALQDIKAVQNQAQRATTEMGRSFTKFTTDHAAQFRKMGMVATVMGGVVTFAVKKMGDSFDKYESALVDMGKITDESLESIENRMKELPPILGSLTELTRGYYQIVSAGIRDPVEATNTLTVSAKTAAAAHMNQSEVVKGLTKVMAGYEGRIKDVSEAADLMFAIEKEGQTTVAELIPVIGGLATMSSQLKISQDEMGASMAVITRTAGSTAEASTEYEGVLNGLMKPTDDMLAAINKMGFATASLAIEELGLVEVLRRLKEPIGDDEVALGKLFGRKQAILGISKLTANEMGTLSDAIDSVAQKGGMADKAFKDWTTTGEAFNKEQKAVTENLIALLGKAIDPMMDVLQRRLIVVLTNMGEWVSKNDELAASLTQLGGGLGIALIPFGALMMMMPGLVIAVPKIGLAITAVSNAFAGWALSLGLTVPQLAVFLVSIGLIVKATYGWIDAIKESKKIKEAEVAATEAQTNANEKLRIAYDLTDEEMQYWIENHKLSAEVLERHKQTVDELAASDYGLMAVQSKVVKSVEETVKSFEELDGAITNSIIKGEELSEEQEAYMAMRQRMSDVDRTATQRKIDDLDRECVAMLAHLETGIMTMEQIDEYRQVMLDHIIAESSEREEHLRNMEEIERKEFELTHSQTEVRIKDLEKKRDAYIEAAKQAMLSAQEEEEAITKIQESYDKEKASILELAIARSEKEIAGLDKAIELRREQGEAIDELIKKRNEEVANLDKLKGAYGETAVAAEKLAAAEAKKKLFKVVDAEGNIIGFRSQQILSQQESAAGVTLVPMVKGGLVQTFIDSIKHLAAGGTTDSVLIAATPGEYVVKKEMVDFIRKTGMVTGGLVEAIQKGLPTPSPAFAGGGMIGKWAGAQPGATPGAGVWGASIVFGEGSVVINARTLDDATVDQAGDKIMQVVTKKAKDAGLVWGRS